MKTRFAREPSPTRLWFQGIPERETVRLGAFVGLSTSEFVAGARAIDDTYAAIERCDLFERDESPLLDSWVFDREHFWLAAPRTSEPVPLIVFVHGNGGTFEFYPDLLARAAVARGFAVAFPSNGFGFWHGQDAAARIRRVVDAVARERAIDRSRVSLVGLSAGGPGIFAAALADRGRYRSLVAVSTIYPQLDRARELAGTRVLVLHGAKDARATIGEARRAVSALRGAGVRVDVHEDQEADHLAVLTRRGEWVPLLLEWVGRE